MKTRFTKTILYGYLVIFIIISFSSLGYHLDSINPRNASECWHQEDGGEIIPCKIDGEMIHCKTDKGTIDFDPNLDPCYIGGGAMNFDPNLSPSYALDFMGGMFYLTVLPLAGLSIGISTLFLVPYFILKRKNIPSRPYMALILSGLLLHYGITSLISFGNSVPMLLRLLDKEPLFFIEQVLPQFLIQIIALGIAGILLYRSSVIRRLLKK
ncbi:MAG: hypothetical protein ACW9W4_01150 [Candidatus Nitrosopumilus sp. bin_7KS]